MTSYIREVFTLSAHQKPTVGDTKFSVVPTDHMGWLNCDGRSLSVSSYVLNPAGGDKAHNNVQPTIGMGNMFIYSGKVNLGSFPYTTGTLLF
jgi:microcystin-dependent protein